jgi:hypothetical protein
MRVHPQRDRTDLFRTPQRWNKATGTNPKFKGGAMLVRVLWDGNQVDSQEAGGTAWCARPSNKKDRSRLDVQPEKLEQLLRYFVRQHKSRHATSAPDERVNS